MNAGVLVGEAMARYKFSLLESRFCETVGHPEERSTELWKGFDVRGSAGLMSRRDDADEDWESNLKSIWVSHLVERCWIEAKGCWVRKLADMRGTWHTQLHSWELQVNFALENLQVCKSNSLILWSTRVLISHEMFQLEKLTQMTFVVHLHANRHYSASFLTQTNKSDETFKSSHLIARIKILKFRLLLC